MTRRIGLTAFGLAIAGLALLHALPTPLLHAASGASIPYRPWNFLSELARTQYAPLMDACFVLLAVGVLSLAALLRRRFPTEAMLLACAGIAVGLLAVFPTDLADMTTDRVTCGLPGRIEPCTVVGRIHNPVSILVFVPISLVILSVCARSRRGETRWRVAARFAAVCGILALCEFISGVWYLRANDWHGRLWNGLMQRSIVFPAILWLTGLLASYRDEPVKYPPVATRGPRLPSRSGRTRGL